MADRLPGSGHEPVGVAFLGMGGPTGSGDVERFLLEMFSDRAILGLPDAVRPRVAALMAKKVAPRSKRRYGLVGGASPAHAAFARQAGAIQEALGAGFLVRHVFRYSAPRAADVVLDMAAQGVKRIVALPSYPQFSRSTTGSSLENLQSAVSAGGASAGKRMEIRAIHSYPDDAGFVRVLAKGTAMALEQAGRQARVVMTAHSLPKSSVRKGDPYVAQVGATARALGAALPPRVEWHLAFQSRESPVGWVGPTALQTLRKLAGEGTRSVVVVPLSFASESVETLVELDLELREQAGVMGIGEFLRVPVPGLAPGFIDTLARLVRREAGSA